MYRKKENHIQAFNPLILVAHHVYYNFSPIPQTISLSNSIRIIPLYVILLKKILNMSEWIALDKISQGGSHLMRMSYRQDTYLNLIGEMFYNSSRWQMIVNV